MLGRFCRSTFGLAFCSAAGGWEWDWDWGAKGLVEDVGGVGGVSTAKGFVFVVAKGLAEDEGDGWEEPSSAVSQSSSRLMVVEWG